MAAVQLNDSRACPEAWRRGQVRRANAAVARTRALAVDAAEARVEPVTPTNGGAPDAEIANASAQASDVVRADAPSPNAGVTSGPNPNEKSEEPS
jgi:hypothetical protein